MGLAAHMSVLVQAGQGQAPVAARGRSSLPGLGSYMRHLCECLKLGWMNASQAAEQMERNPRLDNRNFISLPWIRRAAKKSQGGGYINFRKAYQQCLKVKLSNRT